MSVLHDTRIEYVLVLDRRHAERRQRVQPVFAERRCDQRRRMLLAAAYPSLRPYLLIPQPAHPSTDD